jgi:restriction system protein
MQINFSQYLLRGLVESFFLFWPFWLLFGVILLAAIIFKLIEKERLIKSGISDIDKMDGKLFEKYLEVLFERLGYKVERTKYIGDYGADLIIRKNGIKTVVQAKRYKGKVGVRAIQEAVGAKGYYSCDRAMVITNSYFTKQAKELADKNEVELWDRKELVRNLLKVKKEGGIEIKESILNSTFNESQSICTVCGIPVSDRVRQYCLNHPEKFGGKIYCYKHQKEVNSGG